MNIKSLLSPKVFKEKIKGIDKEKIDLSDPIFSSEIFQSMAVHGVGLQKEVRKIVDRCGKENDYKLYVKDTIARCEKDFERNPNIKNTGGYIISAILKNYHKKWRSEDEEKEKNEAVKLADKKNMEKINNLVKEWKESFTVRRRPFITKLRNEHLNDALVKSTIEYHAPNGAVNSKMWKGYNEWKKSKLLDRWVDDYLAKKYLDGEFSNLDSYLSKNFSLKRNGTKYILSD